MTSSTLPFELRNGNKFAFLLISNVHTNLPPEMPAQLSNGAWVLNRYPTSPDLHWEKMVGEIRFREITEANLILARVTEGQSYALTQEDTNAGEELAQSYSVLQLGGVAEHQAANLAVGSVDGEACYIRRLSSIEQFHQTRGYVRIPITIERLEHASRLASSFKSLNCSPMKFGRFGRGLCYLQEGLRQITGQERLHRFTRSLEALVLPEPGKTRKQFIQRCQLFALASSATEAALGQAYDMRSDTEHIHDWDRSLKNVAPEKPEDVASWRTRQMEALSSFAYTHVLINSHLHSYFENDAALLRFWNTLSGADRAKLWGDRFDLSTVKIARTYDQWGRGIYA
jgi:hypothetical protein